jgi:hypothetical protein
MLYPLGHQWVQPDYVPELWLANERRLLTTAESMARSYRLPSFTFAPAG